MAPAAAVSTNHGTLPRPRSARLNGRRMSLGASAAGTSGLNGRQDVVRLGVPAHLSRCR